MRVFKKGFRESFPEEVTFQLRKLVYMKEKSVPLLINLANKIRMC